MEKPYLFRLYRASLTPSTPVPFGARSVGHCRVPPGWRDTPVPKHFVQFYWGVRGAGRFELNGQVHDLPPEHVFHYLPGEPHAITGGPDGWWEYRWLTLDGGLATAVTTAFGLPRCPLHSGPCPAAQFSALERLIRNPTPHGQCLASAAAYGILCAAIGSHERDEAARDPLAAAAISEIERSFADPGLNVSILATRLGVHRVTLSRRFQKQTGMAVFAYLRAARMQHAMALLNDTGMSVAAVARACGCGDPNYFCKLIRQTTGLPPSRFRT